MRPPHDVKVNLVYCSVDKDEKIREEIDAHMTAVKRELHVECWHPKNLRPGVEQGPEILKRYHEADVVVILISQHLLASQHHYEVELPAAMKRRQTGCAAVLPVMVRRTDLKGTFLEGLRPIPRNGSAIASARGKKEDMLREVAEEVRSIIEKRAWNTEERVSDKNDLPRAGQRFTMDLGYREGLFYRPGPLVITYLQPGAVLEVADGPPWSAEEDAPTIVKLTGEKFNGEFFVDHGWSIQGRTRRCVCSGFYPYEGLPLINGAYPLSDRGQLFYQYGKVSYVAVPIDGANLAARQKKALEDAEKIWGLPLEAEAWDEKAWTSYTPSLTAAAVFPRLGRLATTASLRGHRVFRTAGI